MHELRISKEEREEKTVALYAFITSEQFKSSSRRSKRRPARCWTSTPRRRRRTGALGTQREADPSLQKARSDLAFEIDRIIGTAGNGPEA